MNREPFQLALTSPNSTGTHYIKGKGIGMTIVERVIVRIWGHSGDVRGLLIFPTLIFTLMIAVLVVVFPDRKLFFFVVWCLTGITQAFGVVAALKIKQKSGGIGQ